MFWKLCTQCTIISYWILRPDVQAIDEQEPWGWFSKRFYAVIPPVIVVWVNSVVIPWMKTYLPFLNTVAVSLLYKRLLQSAHSPKLVWEEWRFLCAPDRRFHSPISRQGNFLENFSDDARLNKYFLPSLGILTFILPKLTIKRKLEKHINFVFVHLHCGISSIIKVMDLQHLHSTYNKFHYFMGVKAIVTNTFLQTTFP